MFGFNNLYSQDIEYIKKSDTIYISFEEGKYDSKIDFPEEKDGFKNRRYIFNNKQKNENVFYFEFKKNQDRIVEQKKADKSFLKQNKQKIVKISSLKKNDFQEIQCELFNRRKVFYIIDFSEKKENKIPLYRVIPINSCQVYE